MKDASGFHAFAFQNGSWSVAHRKLRQRLVGCKEWYEFEGRCCAWELLGGAGNVDDHWIGDPFGAYAAATIRRLEPDSKWSIWWADSRRAGLDAPLHGSFENGIGTFFGTDQLDGRPILVRFIWSHLTETCPRWEQAFSVDDGKTWETNWVMVFSPISPERATSGVTAK